MLLKKTINELPLKYILKLYTYNLLFNINCLFYNGSRKVIFLFATERTSYFVSKRKQLLIKQLNNINRNNIQLLVIIYQFIVKMMMVRIKRIGVTLAR